MKLSFALLILSMLTMGMVNAQVVTVPVDDEVTGGTVSTTTSGSSNGNTSGAGNGNGVTVNTYGNTSGPGNGSTGTALSPSPVQSSPSDIKSGQACFAECKKSGGFLGIGAKAGFERPSCEPCMRNHPDLFTFCPNAVGDEVVMRHGDACFDACKPKKSGLLGFIGKTKAGTDRQSCHECLERSGTAAVAVPSGSTNDTRRSCFITPDRQYAYCDGDTYKLDSSTDTGDRSVFRDKGTRRVPTGSPTPAATPR